MDFDYAPKRMKPKKEVRILREECEMLSEEVDELRRENNKLTKGVAVASRAAIAVGATILLNWVLRGSPRRIYSQ